ncbi:MAG: 50S ribosomal protein L21 [Gemmatimonadetes bacterium]|nr:50S ribosomal protein L21 [Gemmatimonadota bacterium]
MYAIIRSGGKQFRAEPGKTIRVPTLQAETGATVTFDEVLLADTGDGVRVGTPVVAGATVTGEVLGEVKAKKVITFKWKRRKNYRRKQGHRQKYTEVRVGEIRLA